MYHYNIFFCGLLLALESSVPILVEKSFCCRSNSLDVQYYIRISDEWDPPTEKKYLGDDFLMNYYQTAEGLLGLAKKEKNGIPLYTRVDWDSRMILCVVNRKAFPEIPYSVGWLIRLLPIRRMLQREGILFLHSSQIRYKDCGIVFAANSGVGKTTQASLWGSVTGACQISNDRSALWKAADNRWYGMGCPYDGNRPVHSELTAPTGAIVLLEQSPENTIRRLGCSQAIAGLLPHIVLDAWDDESCATAALDVMSLWGDVPVYHLACTPTPDAVAVLYRELIREGIIHAQ